MALIRECQLCEKLGKKEQADVDQATVWGPWAYMCRTHSFSHGVGQPTYLDRVG